MSRSKNNTIEKRNFRRYKAFKKRSAVANATSFPMLLATMKTLVEEKLATESFQCLRWHLSYMQSKDLPKYLQGLSVEAYLNMLTLPKFKKQFITRKMARVSATKIKISNISQIGINRRQDMLINKLQCKLDVGFAAANVLNAFTVVKEEVASEKPALVAQSEELTLTAL